MRYVMESERDVSTDVGKMRFFLFLYGFPPF